MTVEQMEEFVGFIKNGRGADGKPHKAIARFNKRVMKIVAKGIRIPTTRDEILKAGIQEMRRRNFRLLAAGAVISTMAGQLLADEVGILDVAANSKYYKQALLELQEGNLAAAQRLLTGGEDSLYVELLGKVSAAAALNFQRRLEEIFSKIQGRMYD